MNRAEKRCQKKVALKATRIAKLEKATIRSPDQQTLTIQQALGLSVQHQTAGRLSEAESIYKQILQLDPNEPSALHLLGVIALQGGRHDTAVDLITKALAIQPDYSEAHNSLGMAFKELGQLDEAVASYRKAIAINPDFAKAHLDLSYAFNEQGRSEDAIASCHKALAINPNLIEAHNNLGIAFKEMGQLDDAVESYSKAIAINPDFAEIHINLGNALKELFKLDDAVASFNKALDINPNFAEAHLNLGMVFQEQGNVDDAIKQCDLAISYEPRFAGWCIRKALLLPIIPYSEEDIRNRRKNLGEAVQSLRKQNLSVENPTVEVGTTNFYLAYHSQNNRTLLEDIAKLHIAACPKLTYEAKHCQSKNGRQNNRLRIGFLSSFFREHTIGKLLCGIIEHFSRDHFEVIVFRLPRKKDEMSEVIEQAAEKVVPLRKQLDRDWRIIAEEELDILFYYDIGMDQYSYFLSFARLAPVQAVSWGHPDTTGIPNIDYFISSDLLEDPGTSRQYTEQLVQLSVLPTYYFPPKLPEKTFDRAEFGLPDEGSLYVCPQSLFKLHPEFDKVIGDLLRHDPVGRLVLIDDGTGGHWNNLIIERIGRSCPDIVDRVKFVPRMPDEKFLGLLILADALLDVPTFSGGNSSLEAFAMAAPIVTLPGNFMRSRTTAGCYKQMGLSDLIASDADSYVSLALKLAHDADFRSRMQTDIKANSHKLYERIEVVREMEAFFIQAYNSSQKGEVLTDTDLKKLKGNRHGT